MESVNQFAKIQK